MTDSAAGVGVGKLTKECREGVQEVWTVLDGRVYYLSGLGCGLRVAAIRYYQRFRPTGKASQLRLGRNMAVSGLELASALCIFGLCGCLMWPANKSGTSLQRLCVNGEYQWLGKN